MATLTAVANPEEPDTGIMTIAEIMEYYEQVRAEHPNWFRDGQGWPEEGKEETNASTSL